MTKYNMQLIPHHIMLKKLITIILRKFVGNRKLVEKILARFYKISSKFFL